MHTHVAHTRNAQVPAMLNAQDRRAHTMHTPHHFKGTRMAQGSISGLLGQHICTRQECGHMAYTRWGSKVSREGLVGVVQGSISRLPGQRRHSWGLQGLVSVPDTQLACTLQTTKQHRLLRAPRRTAMCPSVLPHLLLLTAARYCCCCCCCCCKQGFSYAATAPLNARCCWCSLLLLLLLLLRGRGQSCCHSHLCLALDLINHLQHNMQTQQRGKTQPTGGTSVSS
jgi:hypothetical protein